MAEVTRVLGRMQVDTEGGLVPACGTEGLVSSVPLHSRRRSKLVGDSTAVGSTKAGRKMAVERNKVVGCFTGEIGVMKAELVNKEAPGSFTGEIGVMKAELVNKEAPGIFNGEIGVTKADLGNMEAPGIFSGEIGVTKADLGNMEAPGIFTGEIGVTKADLGNKEAPGIFTGEIGVTEAVLLLGKADLGNKEAPGIFTGEIGVTEAVLLLGNKEVTVSVTGEIDVTKAGMEAAGTGVVTEASWIEFVFLSRPPAGICMAEPTVAITKETTVAITKERVPDSFIDRLKGRRIFKKLPPIGATSSFYSKFPKTRDSYMAHRARWNYLIDLHVDVLRQHASKGFAEVGVDFTDGVKKLFIIPH